MAALSRKRLLCLAAALLPLAVVCLLLSCPRRPRFDPDWTPRGLHAELHRRGLEYESFEVPPFSPGPGVPVQLTDSGLWLKRAGDGRPWPELTASIRLYAHRWRGLLLVRPAESELTPVVEKDGCALLGPLVVYGDPAEIRRVLAALR
jgi:hypothetical protein